MPKKSAKKVSRPKPRAKAKGRNNCAPLSRSLRIYQKVAMLFVLVSFILLLIVLYLSVSKAQIKVEPKSDVVSSLTVIDITPSPSKIGQASGFVVEDTFTKTKTYNIPEQGGDPVDSKAGGMVTMINETGGRVDLVARTRLLSEEGILFRLDEAVSIPASGQVEAVAHADLPGVSGEVLATQFTVPGLSEAKQSQIYAVSVDKMTGGVTYVRSVTQEDLDSTAIFLTAEILEEAKAVLRETFEDEEFDGESFVIEEIEKSTDAVIGSEAGSFNISLTLRITGIFYNQKMLEDHARAILYQQLPKGFELELVNAEGMQAEVQTVDVESETAELSVYLDGLAVISSSHDLLSVDRFIGKTPQEVETLLESSEYIDSVEVSFTPFWLKRIPTLKDHISVKVK